MHSFQSFTADMLECSPFDKIGKEWMLVTAGNEEKVNTMTASWGGMGDRKSTRLNSSHPSSSRMPSSA